MAKLFSSLLSAALCVVVATAQGQESDLPAPPKAPKSLKQKFPDLEKEQASPAPSGAKEVPPAADVREGRRERRPFRVRVVAPFVHVDVGNIRDQPRTRPAAEPAEPVVRPNGAKPSEEKSPSDLSWRYR